MPTKSSIVKGAVGAAAGRLGGGGGAAAGARGPSLVTNPRTGALGKWVPLGARLARHRRPRARAARRDPFEKLLPMLLMVKLLESK